MNGTDERLSLGCLSVVFCLMDVGLLIQSIIAFRLNSIVPVPSEYADAEHPSEGMPPALAFIIGSLLLILAIAGTLRLWKTRRDKMW